MVTAVRIAERNGLSSSDNSLPPSSIHQLEFATLASEVVVKIFSYLGQEDCLSCMAVCRQWYEAMPVYTRRVWISIQLGPRDIIVENKRRIKCLGNHVKKIVMDTVEDDKELVDLMCKVFSWGCTEIEHLEFKNCVSDDQNAFVDALSKLATHLAHLEMIDHVSDIPYLHVLNACPKLSYFTFSAPDDAADRSYFDEPVMRKRLLGTELHLNLIYLCLDVSLDSHSRLEPILKMCPNLRCFIGASADEGRFSEDLCRSDLYRDTTLEPATFFDFCPKLTHLQNNYSYISTVSKLRYIYNELEQGLRYYSQCEDDPDIDWEEPDVVAPILTKYQSTLEHLYIQRFDSHGMGQDWSEVLESLRMPNLRVLDISVISFSDNSLISLVSQSPLIEELSFSGLQRVDYYQQIFHSFPALSYLRILKFSDIDFNEQHDSLMDFLTRFPALEDLSLSYCQWGPPTLPNASQGLYQLKRLQLKANRLTLYGRSRSNDDIIRSLQQLTVHSPKLETVQLVTTMFDTTIMTNIELLKVIASVQTLKICEIDLNHTVLSVEDEQEILKQFIIALKNGTMIEQLKFGYLRDLRNDILDELSELSLLARFYTTAPPLDKIDTVPHTHTLDGSSLLNMLHKSNSLAYVKLHNVMINSTKQDFSICAELIKQKFPAYNLSWSSVEHECSGEESLVDNGFRCDITIKRL